MIQSITTDIKNRINELKQLDINKAMKYHNINNSKGNDNKNFNNSSNIKNNSINTNANNIIKNKIIINSENPLLLAIQLNDYEKIISIISQYPIENINKPFYNGKTIMSLMIEYSINNKTIFDLLFNKQAYIEKTYAKEKNVCLLRRNKELINSIVENGFYVRDEKTITCIKTPIIYYTKLNIINMVSRLAKNDASIDDTDFNGFTPIFYAIKNQNLDMVKLFIKRADLTKTNNIDQTPLIYAKELSKNNKYKNETMNNIISMLEEYSQKENNLSKSNNKIININEEILNFNSIDKAVIKEKINAAIKKRNYKEILTILKQYCIHPLYNEDFIIDMLIYHKVNNKKIFDYIIKNKGCIKKRYFNKKRIKPIVENIGLVKSIIKNGFYTKISRKKVKYIETPLLFFIEYNLTEMVKVLLSNNALPEETDEFGNTPIFQAIKNKNFEIFQLLINQYHVDYTKKNKYGDTPLMFAKKIIKNNNILKNKKIIADSFILHLQYLENNNNRYNNNDNNSDNNNNNNNNNNSNNNNNNDDDDNDNYNNDNDNNNNKVLSFFINRDKKLFEELMVTKIN